MGIGEGTRTHFLRRGWGKNGAAGQGQPLSVIRCVAAFSAKTPSSCGDFAAEGADGWGIGEGTRMHFLHRARGRSERLQKGLQACGNFGIAGVVRMQPVRQKFFL